MAKRKGQQFDERAIIVQLRWVLWSQRGRRSTRYLQISRWPFGADSSIILKFIAIRVEARGGACSWPVCFVASL